MKFGFVTFDNAKDAYRAIDCSTRDDTIKMYDVSFGGRRAFCKSTYLDLGIYKHQCVGVWTRVPTKNIPKYNHN